MKDNKCTLRYLGYRTLSDGGRGFDFSFALAGEGFTQITIEASAGLFSGPDHIALQEGAGICYETLKSRIETASGHPPSQFSLTSNDIAQHRKVTKPHGRRG